MAARLHIDWTACRGHGLCAELLPELLGRDRWGYPLPHKDLTVPDELTGHAREAARLCPRLALHLADPRPEPSGHTPRPRPAGDAVA